MRYDVMSLVGLLAVMWVSCLGCGLALERLLRVRLANALLLSLGLCVAFVLTFAVYVAGAGDVVAVTVLVGVASVGLALAQDGLRARLNPGWPGAAGAAAYVLYMLPVIATGHWTWSGYDFVNDSAFEMLLAEHMKGYGTALGNIPETSAREFLNSYLGGGYPLGTQGLLATFSGLTDTPVAVIYQSYIAGLAASGAIALSTITSSVMSARRAALAGFLAMAANLTYQYALQGAIKEIGLVATVCATVALTRQAILLGRPYVGAVLVAVPAAAALATYNVVAVPYLGAIALLLLPALLVARRIRIRRPIRLRLQRRWLGPVLAATVLTAVLALPSLTTLRTFLNVAKAGQGSTGVGATQLGQLLRPLPVSEVSGVWLAGEYRQSVAPEPAATLTVIASAAMLLLLIPGLIFSLWLREIGPLLLLGTMGLVLAIVSPRVSPYAQGKLLAIASPAVVLVALVCLVSARRLWFVTLPLAGALAVAVLASDLLAYGFDRVAPIDRMKAIQQTGDHLRGRGLVLWNEFEEYAKYFGRAANISVPFEALTPQQVKLRNPTYFYGRYFDLDDELLSFVEGYPIIVTRRSPSASRPPANYELDYENRYYLAWRRTGRLHVLAHLPAQGPYTPSARVTCSALARFVAGAPARARLVEALAPELRWFDMVHAFDRSPGWGPYGPPGAVLASTPGHAIGTLTVGGNARYGVWVQGDFPRLVHVQVDGREVGSVSGSDTPGQWLRAASLVLSPGAHTIRITKMAGHRHLGPQEWGIGLIGAVALEREAAEQLRTLPLAHWKKLCGENVDWVEIVRAR